MSKFAIVPNDEAITVGASYIVTLPDNSVVNVVAEKLGTYTDSASQNHQQLNIIPAKLLEKITFLQADTDQINGIWDATALPEEFIRINVDGKLVGQRYDELTSSYIFDENRNYPIWSDIIISDFEFTNLDQTNTNLIIDAMYLNNGNAPDVFKWVVFNTEPGASQISKLESLVESIDLQVQYFDIGLNENVLIL